MRKVIIHKWLLLTLLLIICLTAFSFIAWQKTKEICHDTRECCHRHAEPERNGEMLWDAVSRQFISIFSLH